MLTARTGRLRRVGHPLPNVERDVEGLGQKAREAIRKILGRSLAIREVDAGSCNGCELEIVALNNPVHDIEGSESSSSHLLVMPTCSS